MSFLSQLRVKKASLSCDMFNLSPWNYKKEVRIFQHIVKILHIYEAIVIFQKCPEFSQKMSGI